MPSQTPTLSVLLFDISIETLDDEIFLGLLSMHACMHVCMCVCVCQYSDWDEEPFRGYLWNTRLRHIRIVRSSKHDAWQIINFL